MITQNAYTVLTWRQTHFLPVGEFVLYHPIIFAAALRGAPLCRDLGAEDRATGGVYKGQGRSQCQLMTCAC